LKGRTAGRGVPTDETEIFAPCIFFCVSAIWAQTIDVALAESAMAATASAGLPGDTHRTSEFVLDGIMDVFYEAGYMTTNLRPFVAKDGEFERGFVDAAAAKEGLIDLVANVLLRYERHPYGNSWRDVPAAVEMRVVDMSDGRIMCEKKITGIDPNTGALDLACRELGARAGRECLGGFR